MGTALSRAAQWTSVSDSSKGKLEFSKVNGKLLTQISEFTKSFPSKFPEEASYVFRNELSWMTTTSADLFGSGYETSGSRVTSTSKDENGQPLMTLDGGMLKVRTLAEASNILSVVKKENELQEVRLCLEANRDPIEKILGPGFATVEGEEQTILRMFKKLESEESKEGSIQLKLALLIQRFDVTLLNTCLQDISQEVRLTVDAVNEEVNLLNDFAGDAPSCPIVRIEYTPGFETVFSNGSRAVPWRQVHGDICHLLIETHDKGEISVTASTFGCFENCGVKEDGSLDYEKKYENKDYKTITALLSDVSKTFRDNISNKNFLVLGEKAQSESDFTNIVENDTERESAVDRQSVEGKPTAQKSTKKVRTHKDRKLNMQPSMKWKNLETTETKPTVTVIAKKQTRSGSKHLSPRAIRRASQYRFLF